jgi:hypothetical protein
MLMKQCKLKQDDGATMVSWIDQDHAIIGHRFDLNLGDGQRSPVMTVVEAWDLVRDLDEIKQREQDRRNFGGSIR